MGRMGRVLRRYYDALLEYLEVRAPQGSGLRTEAQGMLVTLEANADATSLAMTLADERYEKLGAAMREHDELGRQAEDFLREGKTAEAERCLERQLELADKITELKALYEASQRDAEARVLQFQTEREQVKRRVDSIPELRDTERLNQAQKKVNERAAAYSLEGPKQAFDDTAGNIRREARQLTNKTALTVDPKAGIDRSITESQKRRRLLEAMTALRERVAREGSEDVIYADSVEDPVSGARKALEAPRFRMLSDGTSAERSSVPTRRFGA